MREQGHYIRTREHNHKHTGKHALFILVCIHKYTDDVRPFYSNQQAISTCFNSAPCDWSSLHFSLCVLIADVRAPATGMYAFTHKCAWLVKYLGNKTETYEQENYSIQTIRLTKNIETRQINTLATFKGKNNKQNHRAINVPVFRTLWGSLK